jgi:hypothetical protein
MAVLYQAQGAIAASTGADVTPVIPTHAADDILIAHVFYRSQTPTTSTPAGWTLLEGPFDGGASTRHYWFWKRAAGASETDPLMDKSAATGDTYARVYTVRGAWTGGDPFEDVVATAHDTSDPFAATGVTSLTANALIFGIVGDADDGAADFIPTATDPATFTQDNDTSTTGGDALMGRFNATKVTAGATGNVIINWQNAPDGGAVLVMAIGDTSSAVNVSITSVTATVAVEAPIPPDVGGPANASVTSVTATVAASAELPAPTLSLATPTATVTTEAHAPTFSSFGDGSIFGIPTPSTETVYVGTDKAVYAQFRDTDGVFYDPTTVQFKTHSDDGDGHTYLFGTDSEVEWDANGVYHLTFNVDRQGEWKVAAKGEDTDAVGQVTFTAIPSIFD